MNIEEIMEQKKLAKSLVACPEEIVSCNRISSKCDARDVLDLLSLQRSQIFGQAVLGSDAYPAPV